MIKTITILGGGTAGLISALMLRATYPKLKITVIESSQYGVVGVGEGSTEHWAGFMALAKINITDLVRETGATYKTGIRFENWHGDNTEFWHSLGDIISYQDPDNGIYAPMMKHIVDGKDPLLTVLPASLESKHAQPFDKTVHQYHFDTNKLNVFFHKLCNERNIKVIDDIVNDVIIKDGVVKSLIGEKESYTADFFIDSSGFRKVINSKLGTKWIDCEKYLPMNSAIAAQTPYLEDIPSHTLAKALSTGWMWRIPTQDRFGNGYVYCDKFISDEDAEKEFQSQFDHDVTIGKKFKFSAGYVDKFWTSNCVSVGLAGMFVEPLEASSIGFTIQQMFSFCANILHWSDSNDLPAKEYNKQLSLCAENIISFVQIHYLTERNDSEFWKWASNNITLTDFNQETLSSFEKSFPTRASFNKPWLMFKELNWLQTMHGLRLFNNDAIQTLWSENLSHLDINISGYWEQLNYDVSQIEYVPHRTALNELSKEGASIMAWRDNIKI